MKYLWVVVNIVTNFNYVLSVKSFNDPKTCQAKCREISLDWFRNCNEICDSPETALRNPNISQLLKEQGIPSTEATKKVFKPEISKNPVPLSLQSSECPLGDGEVIVPVYVLYILGTLMFLMSLIIVYLAVLIYGNKLREYTFLETNTAQNNAQNAEVTRAYTSQVSQEMTLLNMCPSQEKTNQEPNSKKTCGNISMIDAELNSKDDNCNISQNQKDLKIYKSVRKPADHQVLLREQMKKICEDALAKSQNSGLTASLKDLNKLLNDTDQPYKQPNVNSRESVREKSASYPQLDIYDEPPPKNIPVEDTIQPVYDCLPTSKNIIIEDYDTKYLLAISKDTLTEPDYINAQYRFQ